MEKAKPKKEVAVKKTAPIKKTISDEEFASLLSKVKTFKIEKNKDISFSKAKAKKVTKKSTISMYKRMLGMYESLLETKKEPKQAFREIKTKKVRLTFKEVDGLEQALGEVNKKLEQYFINSLYQGGPGVIIHDSTLSGTGIPGDPLKVVSSGGGSGFTYSNEIVAGSGTTFTLAHVPTNSAGLLLFGGGSALIQGADYTIAGAVITMTNPYSAGQVVAFYS